MFLWRCFFLKFCICCFNFCLKHCLHSTCLSAPQPLLAKNTLWSLTGLFWPRKSKTAYPAILESAMCSIECWLLTFIAQAEQSAVVLFKLLFREIYNKKTKGAPSNSLDNRSPFHGWFPFHSTFLPVIKGCKKERKKSKEGTKQERNWWWVQYLLSLCCLFFFFFRTKWGSHLLNHKT